MVSQPRYKPTSQSFLSPLHEQEVAENKEALATYRGKWQENRERYRAAEQAARRDYLKERRGYISTAFNPGPLSYFTGYPNERTIAKFEQYETPVLEGYGDSVLSAAEKFVLQDRMDRLDYWQTMGEVG